MTESIDNGIAQRISELAALEQERATLASQHEGMLTPSAKLKVKELDVRIAMLADNILSDLNLSADINRRANRIAVRSI
ncbi:hypothetical protein INH39_30510 [Massilia violaceinigra]|uniref:Uncharacterized protein n=1 Tax=Massilia violaceinigra TaxID=2045208 RepID=A0ABY4A7M4_9BURK|nr:hypothetical protein [Massilia violaceinigra]UOD29669.1 hypothetical protein INH39_30510 [Massilia violaceinigra]